MSLMSMTGFGRARGALSDRLSASVVVRSVNHKYLDVQVRTGARDELPEAEAAVRAVVGAPLARGRVSVLVNLERTAPGGARALVDVAALTELVAQLESIPAGIGGGAPSLGELLGVPGLVSVSSAELLLDQQETAALTALADEAVAAMVRMRREEGERLGVQLEAELARLHEFLDWLEPRLGAVQDRLRERLDERVRELLGEGRAADEGRILQEVAMLADRSDVAEEVVRLRSHLAGFAARLERGGAVGRALDFLCQEIHRELNTIGSKCREPGVVEHLVEARTAAERAREQVQNVE